MPKIKVIIVDDHEIFRDGIKLVLSQTDNYELVANASNGEEFLSLIEDIFLVNFSKIFPSILSTTNFVILLLFNLSQISFFPSSTSIIVVHSLGKLSNLSNKNTYTILLLVRLPAQWC